MNKQFFAIIIVVIVGMVGIFALTGGNNGGNTENGDDNTEAQPTNHVVGPEDAKVTLIEYGDFQCPACKSYVPLVDEIKKTYSDRIKFQFRHYPLVQIHPHAFIASRAAEAAGNQGKFYEMHDLLYENQESWSASSNPTPTFEAFARQLELDIEKFKADMNSAAIAAAINADVKEAQAAGANSTPTFVLNGSKIDNNPQNLDEFKKLIDEELTKN